MASEARSSYAPARDSADRERPRRSANGQAEARALFRAWQRDGDQRARERLVERYMPLARTARQTVREGHRADRRPDAGCLDRAGERDRPLRRDPGPAVPGVRRADDPRRDAPLLPGLGLGAARAAHRQRAGAGGSRRGRRAAREHGRSPTANQLAEYLELEIDEVLDAMAAMDAYETSSLDAPRPSEDGPGVSYADSLGVEDERFDLIECDATLCAALGEAEAARSLDPPDALRGGADASRDREPDRGLADARVEAAAAVGGEAAAPHAVRRPQLRRRPSPVGTLSTLIVGPPARRDAGSHASDRDAEGSSGPPRPIEQDRERCGRAPGARRAGRRDRTLPRGSERHRHRGHGGVQQRFRPRLRRRPRGCSRLSSRRARRPCW